MPYPVIAPPAPTAADVTAAGGALEANLSSLRYAQAANRCFMPRNAITGANAYAKTEDVVFTTQGGFPRVGWARWRVSNNLETAPAGDGTLIVRMEYPAGVYTYARENIAAGSQATPAPVAHPTNSTLFLNFDTFVPAGAAPRFRVIQTGTDVIFRQGQIGDQAAPGCYLNNGSGTPPAMEAAFGGGASEYSYPPVAYLVQHRAPSVLQFGDSREETGTEAGRPPYYNNGLTLPAIHGAGIGYTCLTESGTGLNQFLAGTAAQRARRVELAQYYSHVECTWGVNDLNAYGRSVAQLTADYTTFAGLFPNNVVFQTTIAPLTASTDGYTTLANQTISANAIKVRQVNTLIRAGVSGMKFVLDTADAIDPFRTGKWPVARDPSASARATGCTFTGYIPANSSTLTVVSITSGALNYGDSLVDNLVGASTTALSGCTILDQLTGTAGSTGTYTISRPPVNAQGTSGSPKTFYVGGYGSGDSLHQTKDLSEQVEKVLTPIVRARVTR